ncbi:MAG: hypothetical protein D6722_25420 [Bacteroidetes bacterium]|nr:MAG: hypothetical protein D6722_25420 [Bacteroidota bacterium]
MKDGSFLRNTAEASEWRGSLNPVSWAEKGQDVLGEAERLEALQAELESLAYAISHDLRASARRVYAFSELLRAPRSQEEGEELMLGLQQASSELSRDMDAMLTYSRLGRVELLKEPVQLGEVTEAVLAKYLPVIETLGIRVRLTALPAIHTDVPMLRRLIDILVDNALKAMSRQAGGELWIRGGHRRDGVSLEVMDTGIGFEPDMAPQLFRMFRRLHTPQEFPVGSGCGLAFARRICQRLGGTIHAFGAPGQGAHFRLWLPAQPGL